MEMARDELPYEELNTLQVRAPCRLLCIHSCNPLPSQKAVFAPGKRLYGKGQTIAEGERAALSPTQDLC